MMKHGLVGLDVLNIAVHLTAAMLAGSHPDTPFDGECLLTMPYGEQKNGNGDVNSTDLRVAVGSLDLLEEPVQWSFMDTAAAVSAGGRAPEEIRDLVSRVGHGKFDLVIMNPPFTRPTNHEGRHSTVPIPSFAAFENTPEQQDAMSDRVKELTKGAPSHGNAGEASEFVELAHRKVRDEGTVALVLPSALSAVAPGARSGDVGENNTRTSSSLRSPGSGTMSRRSLPIRAWLSAYSLRGDLISPTARSGPPCNP